MLKVYNTLGRKKEEFKSLNEGKISFYHCGPTVYWTQHIGNMRGMTMGDLIRRTLIYLGYEVRYVSNYTDFGHLTSDADEGEDKMEKGAKRDGTSPKEVADKYIGQFENDTKALNILEPTVRARATNYIDEMIELVQKLLDKGYAYGTPKAIYFDVGKFENYTELSGRDLEKDRKGEGHGKVSDSDKKHPADFAVWFFKTGAHKNALQYWKSPFKSPEVENGEGIPGWHIECSAMALSNLGATLDIHLAGVEHISIHNPNEKAQSEAANDKKFVNYWLHNEHLTVDGGKMAKSEGSGYTLDEVIEKGFRPVHLRYLYLQAHYRSKQNFTWEALDGAKNAYQNLVKQLKSDNEGKEEGVKKDDYESKFKSALEDDFNIPEALAVVWEVAKSNLSNKKKVELIKDFDTVLGLNILRELKAEPKLSKSDTKEVESLIKKREDLREQKKWKEADEIREELESKYNVEIEDKDSGTKWRTG